jgi:RNA polymerase sigma-70 factor (ECF subfamily)
LAEDLTATMFEKAWRERARYRRDLAAFSTWLFTIARNVGVDHLRQFKQERLLDDALHLGDDTLEAIVQRRSDHERLTVLLAALPARTKIDRAEVWRRLS